MKRSEISPTRMSIALVLLLCSTSASLFAQEKAIDATNNVENSVSKKKEKAMQECSLFQAPMDNAKAWRSGDFLVRVVRRFDNIKVGYSPSGGSYESKQFLRVAFDIEQDKYSVTRWKTMRILDMEMAKPEEQIESSIGGWAMQNGVVNIFSERGVFQKPVAKYRYEGQRLRDHLQFPDYRTPWMLPFGWGMNDIFNKADRYTKVLVTGNRFHDVKDESEKHTEIVLSQRSDDFHLTHYEAFRFDNESLMPNRYRDFGTLRSTGGKVLGPKYEFAWKDIDGVYVPVSIWSQEYTIPSINGREERGMEYREHDFHWFSFNEELPDSCFDGSRLLDEKTIHSLVDPQSLNIELGIPPNQKTDN